MEAERLKIEAALASRIRAETNNPPDIWSEAPSELPQWNPHSPYIWLDKEWLPRLPLRTISKKGELTRETAEILAINETQRQRLNQKLTGIVTESRALAQSVAERCDEEIPAAGALDERRVTIKIQMPMEAAEELKNRYESTLRDELGEERGNLIRDSVWASNWFQTEFGSKPEYISVVRRSNGTYNIAFKERGSSMGGVTRLDDYIPEQFLPLFDAVR